MAIPLNLTNIFNRQKRGAIQPIEEVQTAKPAVQTTQSNTAVPNLAGALSGAVNNATNQVTTAANSTVGKVDQSLSPFKSGATPIETQTPKQPTTIVTETQKKSAPVIQTETIEQPAQRTPVTQTQETQASKQPVTQTTPIETQATRQPTTTEEKAETGAKKEPVTTTEVIPPEQRVETDLDAITKLMDEWASGNIKDEVFNRSVNEFVGNISLYNQTQIEDLQKTIASDPNITQGAGIGLLQMMARNQGYDAGQMLSKLSVENAKRILEMQRFGINRALDLERTQYDRKRTAIEDAIQLGDYDGAAGLATDMFRKQFPGIPITITGDMVRNRDLDFIERTLDINMGLVGTQIENGDFEGGAANINKILEEMGMDANVTAEDLRNMDPTQMTILKTRMDGLSALVSVDREQAIKVAEGIIRDYPAMFKDMTGSGLVDSLARTDPTLLADIQLQLDMARDIVSTDPDGAKEILESLISANPDKFGKITPDQMVQAWLSGDFQTLQPVYDNFQTEINLSARADQTFFEVEGFYDQMGSLGGGLFRDFTAEGERLTLEEVNALYEKNGMQPVDSLEDLDPEDFKQLGQMKDYEDRLEQLDPTAIYDAILDAVKADPEAQEWIDENYYKGSRDALQDYLSTLYTGGSYEIDPSTGVATPNLDAAMSPWDNPKNYHIFYTWPAANFEQDANGNWTITGQVYPGGDTYADKAEAEGKDSFTPDADDLELDKKWNNYVRNNQNNPDILTGQQWYFATAGGQLTEPNNDLIPENIKPTGGGDDFLDVGEWETVNASGKATLEQAQAAAEAGELPSYDPNQSFRNFDRQAYLQENPSGWINIGGNVYKLTPNPNLTTNNNLTSISMQFDAPNTYVTNSVGDVFFYRGGENAEWYKINYNENREVTDIEKGVNPYDPNQT